MVRACCVLNCTIISTMPFHVFPKNSEIRDKWLANLILKSYKEDELHKLRVYYKHFKDTDYTLRLKFRKLNPTAVPYMNTLTSISETQIDIETMYKNEEIIAQQNKNILEQDTQLQANVEKSQQNEYTLSQQDMAEQNIIRVSQQEHNITQLQTNVKNLLQMQTQHYHELNNMKKKLGLLKTQIQNSQAKMFNLKKLERRKNLSPIAKRYYNENVKLKNLKTQNRCMNRTMKRLKQQYKNKKITLKKRIFKGKEDNTRKIRQDFIDMLVSMLVIMILHPR